jgi:hypothetical protein
LNRNYSLFVFVLHSLKIDEFDVGISQWQFAAVGVQQTEGAAEANVGRVPDGLP